MNHRLRRHRLRAAVVSFSLIAAGLAVATGPGATAVPAAVGGPQAVGVLSAPLVYMYPVGQPVATLPVACTGNGLNVTADPSFSRDDCGFARYAVTSPTGAITAKLFATGAATPFATPATAPGTGANAGTWSTTLTPADTWPAGPVTLAVYDGTTQIGSIPLRYNTLVATVTSPGQVAPGAPFTVTGTIAEHDVSGADTADVGVPATFDLDVTDAAGDVLYTAPVTAASNGTFSLEVPADETKDVTAPAGTSTVDLGLRAVRATYQDGTVAWAATEAGSGSKTLAITPQGLLLSNSFVSSVGWVKPGDIYPSTISLSNQTGRAVDNVSVTVAAPDGSTIRAARAKMGSTSIAGGALTWSIPRIAAGTPGQPSDLDLVVESKAATTAALPTIVWRDLSSTATMKVGGDTATATSHGPKVIPPSEVYDTARYGDRPFPIVPVQYTDRDYQPTHSGDSLEQVINDPGNKGSTFNLYQEMSLGQLFPEGTVPSAGIAEAGFDKTFDFTHYVPGQTCTGTTLADAPIAAQGSALYPDRITDGVYNLPGQTQYYGADANGSAVVGSAAGVGALQNIDSGCGPTGKLVYDAAAIADPEVDYSDYDTDKDGVVDFFMVVFAGCGGNGGSQLGAAGCAYSSDTASYDNIWPHSSSLEGAYSDPDTGLPGFTTEDQLKDLEGNPLWYTDTTYSEKTTDDKGEALKVFVRVGPYNVNPETAIDAASVISHEYGHSLGLPDFYSTGSRATYGDWNLMATDKSQNMDAFSRQELGWVVPEVLAPGRTVAEDIPDSKQDIGTITWTRPDGTPYTLESGKNGVGTVHNSQMYVAKLPGRTLLDESVFDTGDKASKSHLWWSGSGNDFGCAPQTGHNFDLAVPGLKDLPAGTKIDLAFKSNWDIEWDFDYGYVLTTTNGGATYTSHPSANGYTTSNTDPTSPNVNQSGCQATYDNGITGTSGSYQAGTEALDRKTGDTPAPVFLADSYDVSDLAGSDGGSIRFSYATDPGLARPGWFVDDVVVTATAPDGNKTVLYGTDFEKTGGPKDPVVYNGGCANDLTVAGGCTQGFKYLQAGAASEQDHAYYLEMRDRSGFDLNGNGEADRGAVTWTPGLYLSYTDEAHGYGNVGTDDPPAQSPLDSVPTPGSAEPDLDDAAFTNDAARSTYTDAKASPHVDNYTDPSTASGNWEFAYDCLSFKVDKLSGATDNTLTGDLTGDVTFDLGTGCGAFNYGYSADAGDGPVNTAPLAKATATPNPATVGQTVSFSGVDSTDAETAATGLKYSWDFGNGGTTKDAEGRDVSFAYGAPGTYQAQVTVDDGQGLTSTSTVPVTVAGPPGSAGTPGTAPGTGTGTVGSSPIGGPLRTKTRIRLPQVVQVQGGTRAKVLFQVVAKRISNGAAGTVILQLDRKKARSYLAPVTAKAGKSVRGFTYRTRKGLSVGPHSLRVTFRPDDPTLYTASRSRLIQLTVLRPGTQLREPRG